MTKYSAQTSIYVWQQPQWPHWVYDNEAVSVALAQARLQQGRVIGKAQAIGLSTDILTEVVNEICVGEVMATAAIEGQRLDFDQVRSSVMRKLGFGITRSSSRRIDGLVDVMHDAINAYSSELSVDRLCSWQSALFPGGRSGIERIEVGSFRKFPEPMQIISGKIGKEVVHYQAPDSAQVPIEMAAFLNWFNKPANTDGIVRAAIAHLWFETIHPFEDGNGRIGRAVMDMAMAQDARQAIRLYSMSRQLQENRTAYYDALNQAQKGGLDITGWLTWFVLQFSEACLKSEVHIDKALEKARYWSEHGLQLFNARQRKTLQKLLDAGDGGFEGGLTAEKYGKITGASKATATRDLADLLLREALISRGVGRATKYYVNVREWKHD
jgi:Fic family protein